MPTSPPPRGSDLTVPTEEESSMLMSSLSENVHICGWVGGKGDVWARQGAEWGLKMGQLILSVRPVRAEVCILVQKATAPSKRAFNTFLNFCHTCVNIMYVP
jgi:hypothetical protein